MAKPIITAQRLRELLHYDPQTGVFTWRTRRCGRADVGAAAGFKGMYGYILICIEYRMYPAHRLAWLYMTGEWPTNYIDHINGIRHENAWGNLRSATHAQNMQNQRRAHTDNKCGFLGVFAHQGRWRAAIMVGRKKRYLGCFDTPELAHAAYLEAKTNMHPFSTLNVAAVKSLKRQ